MVRLKSLISGLLSSRTLMYVLIIVCMYYFTRQPPSETSAMSRYSEMKMLYESGDLIPPGNAYEEVLHERREAPMPPPEEVEVQVDNAHMVAPSEEEEEDYGGEFEGFHSSHNQPFLVGSDVLSQHSDPEEEEAALHVKAHHDPRFADETHEHQEPKFDTPEEHREHAKNPKQLHFSSSHTSPVGQVHAHDSLFEHEAHGAGANIPHKFVSKSHSPTHLDPYYSMHIREQELERMKSSLPKTLPNYRNPCWVEHLPRGFSYFEHTLFYQYYKAYPNAQPHRDWERTYDKLDHLIQVRKKKTKDGKSWRLRCFPYFFLIGFTRAGTTDLWRSMSLLPEFVRGLIKEPKFWNKVRLHNYDAKLPNATLSDYLDLFDGVSEVIRGFSQKLPDGSYYHPGITADMDPATVWKLPKWQHIRGNEDRDSPKVTTADHIHALHPQARFIVMMRDPVERAFSHYCFFKTRKKYTTKSELADHFHHDMVKATKKLIRCFKQRGPKSCAYQPPRYNALAMRSLTVSMYYVFINDWAKVFHKHQFLFIKSEDYFANRVKIIKEVSHFLKIDDDIPDSVGDSINEFRVMNPSSKTGMHRETRELLRDFFRPFNKKLTHMLRDHKYDWDY